MSKTGFRVAVVCDSINRGVRLTTFAVRMPRVVLAEALTHRQLSRNASSSRAIPIQTFIQQVEGSLYIPGDLPDGPLCGNGKGMVATEPLDRMTVRGIGQRYSWAAKEAAASAQHLVELGAHKQDANRLLEPFQWIRWLCTATDWDNFFALRTDHRAYPPFRFLARCMYMAYQKSRPSYAMLHVPFVSGEDVYPAEGKGPETPEWFLKEWNRLDGPLSPKVAFRFMAWSAARCARVSVKNFRTDSTDHGKDFETFEKLTTEYPRHSSPCEHQAFVPGIDVSSQLSSNFRKPWCQFRKLIPLETVTEFRPSPDEVAKWNIPDDVFGGTPGVDW